MDNDAFEQYVGYIKGGLSEKRLDKIIFRDVCKRELGRAGGNVK